MKELTIDLVKLYISKTTLSTLSIRGVSRLKPALRTMILMKRMRDFQDNFFKNGAVPGLSTQKPKYFIREN